MAIHEHFIILHDCTCGQSISNSRRLCPKFSKVTEHLILHGFMFISENMRSLCVFAHIKDAHIKDVLMGIPKRDLLLMIARWIGAKRSKLYFCA